MLNVRKFKKNMYTMILIYKNYVLANDNTCNIIADDMSKSLSIRSVCG